MKDELYTISKTIHSKNENEVEGRIGRFFQRIGSLFKQDSPPETDLSGRIHELETTIDEILDKLVIFKDKAKNETDEELVASLDSTLDTLIRESLGVQKMVERPHAPSLQVKAIKRYVEWLEKARRWSDLADQEYNKELVYKTIIEHIIEDFYLKIDRDVQVIKDYFANSVEHLNAKEEGRIYLQANLEVQLIPYFQKLNSLKEIPKDLTLTLKDFSSWRTLADQSRAATFTKALHLIDLVSENSASFIQKNDTEEEALVELAENEEAPELVHEVKALEDGMKQVLLDIENDDILEGKLLSKLDSLENDAHELNGNLRLSQNQVSRVEWVLETIASLRART